MVTLIVTSKKRNVRFVLDLVNSDIKKYCTNVEQYNETDEMVTLKIKNSISGDELFKIKNEILEWNLVEDVLEFFDDATTIKLVKKFCNNFTIKGKRTTTEREIHKQLYSFLEAKFGRPYIKYEKTEASGGRPDIVVRQLILVELKVPKTSGEIQRIFGQTVDYLKLTYRVVLLLVTNKKYNKKKLIETKNDLLDNFPKLEEVIIR